MKLVKEEKSIEISKLDSDHIEISFQDDKDKMIMIWKVDAKWLLEAIKSFGFDDKEEPTQNVLSGFYNGA